MKILFYSVEKHWGPLTVWLPTFFKISSFVFNTRNNTYRSKTTWGWV